MISVSTNRLILCKEKITLTSPIFLLGDKKLRKPRTPLDSWMMSSMLHDCCRNLIGKIGPKRSLGMDFYCY